MSSIGERIKYVRKQKGLTQQKFADALGLKRNTVGGYEINSVIPSDRTIMDICATFGVNETWLRTGEGEIFLQLSRDEEIAAFLGRIMKGEKGDYRHRLISVLTRLDEDGWELLARVAERLVDETKKTDP